jgi:Protein containing tetrapyrrole methyltransferase domain and MazG-like (predicted pyrophosphatase) domain
VGFDWPTIGGVLDKLKEEIAELETAIETGGDKQHIASEVGDLLFVCANLARHAGCDPETALQNGNAKFERRFRRIEALLAEQARSPQEASLEEMEVLWQRVKEEERLASG